MPTAPPRFPVVPLVPGSYSILDPSGLQAASRIANAPVVAVVGDCKGGLNNVVLDLTTMGQARSVLRSGPAYDAVRAAFLGGASLVRAVRIGTPTASSAALAGATGTPVTLTSLDKGLWTAGIRRTVEANNKLTISYTDPITGETYNEVYALGAAATAAQVAAAINGQNPLFPKSQFVSATSTTVSATMPLTAAASAVLTTAGTDDTSIDAGDWTAGLAALETHTVDLLCVATGDATVHAQAIAHCDLLSSVQARKERVTPIGGAANESVATAAARMTGTLINKRVQLVYPGISLFDDAGVLTAYPPYIAAAFLAGMHAALPDVATSLVGANLGSQVVDVERRLSSIPGGDLDQLLAAGLTPIGTDPAGGFQVIDSLSGYRADSSFRDFHKIRTADYAARTLREEMEAAFKGRKSTPALVDEQRTKANAILDRLVVQEILYGHLPADVVQDGVNSHVSAPVVLPDTNKYVLLTVGLSPASSLAPQTT